MTPTQLSVKLDTLAAERQTLKRYWTTVLANVALPPDAQFDYWIGVYGFPATHYGLRECARKNAKMRFQMTADHALAFTSKVAGECPRADHNQPKPERIAEDSRV